MNSPILSLQNNADLRMIGRMNDEIIKRYSLTEIALLVIFMLGLIIAHIIVKVRHRIILSESIPLAGAGLSVHMPNSSGWEHEKTWRYESDNSMALVAQYQVSRSPQGLVQWRYDICSPGGSAEDLLRQRVEQSGSKLDRIETLSGPVPMQYTTVYPAGGSGNPFYLGVASLDFGRHLELRVFVYHQLDFYYAEDVFRSLAAAIDYQPPHELQAGKELVSEFWNAMQSDSFSIGKKSDEALLIKNAENRPVGYGYQHYSLLGTNSETKLQILNRQYEYNRSQTDSEFWFDGEQKRFTWKTTIQQVGMGRPRNVEVAQESDGTVNVNGDSENNKQFTSGALLLPELLLPQCAAFFLDHEQDRLVVDVIAATGFVVPTILEKLDIHSASAQSDQIAFAVKIDFLNNPNSFEELYFDKNKSFVGRFERQPLKRRIWDSTTVEQLKQIFKDNFQPFNDNVAVAK